MELRQGCTHFFYNVGLPCNGKWRIASRVGFALFIVQTYTGFSMAWATPDTIATIIGLVTPVLVWVIPNKKVART